MWHEIALIYSCHAQAGTRIASQCEAGVGVPLKVVGAGGVGVAAV